MRPTPKIVGLLPAWNASSFIQETLDSLSSQTYKNYHVFASIDLCEDNTAEIIRAHAAKDARFQVIEQKTRLGWVGNINALLAAAEGEYLHFAFHDDVVLPDFAAICGALLEENPAAVLAYPDAETLFADGSRGEMTYDAIHGVASAYERAALMVGMKGDWATPNRGVFRASTARQVGYMRTHRAGEFIADWLWLLALALEGQFVHTPQKLVAKKYLKTSLSRSWRWNYWPITAASEEAARIIAQSSLSSSEKSKLFGLLALRFGKTIGSTTYSRLKNAIGGAS